MKKVPMVKEKKCPECGSEKVGPKGSSHKYVGSRIRLECYDCKAEFYISEAIYKP